MAIFNTGELIQRRIISLLLIMIFSGIILIQTINILVIPPNGQIFDIYGFFPFLYWILILTLIILCGLILSYFSLYNIYCKSAIFFILALFLIVNTLFLQNIFLFFSTGRGDPLYHLGYIKDILFYGHIYYNPYPVTHVLIASLSMLLNIPASAVMSFIPVLLFSVYFLSMFTFGKIFLRENQFFYYFIGLAALPIFGFQQDQFWPNMALIFFTPIIFFILLKCNTKKHKEFFLLWIIMLVFLSYGHQLYSMMWIILFCILFIIYFYYYKYNKCDLKLYLAIVSLIIVSSIFYYQSLLGIQNVLQYSFNLIFQGVSVSEGEGVALASQIAQVKPTSSILIIIHRVLFNYGLKVIFSLISGIIFLYIAYFSIFFKQKFNFIFVLVSMFSLFFYTLAIINMFFYRFESIRFYNMGHIFTIILIPFFLYDIIKKFPLRKKEFLSIMMILFVLLTVISVFTIHSSFYFSNFANEQVTESEYETLTTFLHYRDDLHIIEKGSSLKQFAYSIYGDSKFRDTFFPVDKPKNDLNYDNYNTFAQGLGSNIYFIYHIFYIFSDPNPFSDKSNITFIDLKSPPPPFDNAVVQNMLKFHRKLENDNTVNMIYSNSPTYIYLVR